MEKIFVDTYFVDRKRGDSALFNTSEIKDKLNADEEFLKYLNILKEQKLAEEKEYIEAKRLLEKMLVTLKAQFTDLKKNSREIKENHAKARA